LQLKVGQYLADFPDLARIVTGENDLCHGYVLMSELSGALELFNRQGFTLMFN
jgi:hypothetical protein